MKYEAVLNGLKVGMKVRIDSYYKDALPLNFGIRLKTCTVTINSISKLGFTFAEGTYECPILRTFEHPLRIITKIVEENNELRNSRK